MAERAAAGLPAQVTVSARISGPARGLVAESGRHDQAQATSFVATLCAWLEAQGDLVDAAERLRVHQNTVRNRLRKMAEVTVLGLDDARKRLAMIIDLAAAGTD